MAYREQLKRVQQENKELAAKIEMQRWQNDQLRAQIHASIGSFQDVALMQAEERIEQMQELVHGLHLLDLPYGGDGLLGWLRDQIRASCQEAIDASSLGERLMDEQEVGMCLFE